MRVSAYTIKLQETSWGDGERRDEGPRDRALPGTLRREKLRGSGPVGGFPEPWVVAGTLPGLVLRWEGPVWFFC